jgi:hypothetical protein
MSQRIGAAVLAGVAAVGLCWPAPAADPKARQETTKLSLNELGLEIQALQTLHALNLTTEQLEKLGKLAVKTVEQDTPRQPAKVSAKLRQAMIDLHAALLQGTDDERIEKLLDQAYDLREKEKAVLDDDVDPTDEARQEAPGVLRALKPGQVAGYLGSIADDIPDPLDRLLDALKRVRSLKDEEYKRVRGEVADDVGQSLAGVDADKASEVGDAVQQLLIVARGLSDKEFAKQRPELVKKAKEIVGKTGPTDVLRNVMENHLAKLLSNPRLPAAVDGLLHAEKVAKKAAK